MFVPAPSSYVRAMFSPEQKEMEDDDSDMDD